MKGCVPWNKGFIGCIKHSKETRAKMSKNIQEKMKQFGYRNSPETRRKIGESCKGRIISIEQRIKLSLAAKGKPSPIKGIKWTKEQKVEIAKEKHSRWQGGKSFEPYNKEFDREIKNKVKFRDNFQCQMCGKFQKRNRKFHVHHIDYDKKINKIDNLIYLCIPCHSRTNNSELRLYWTEFFTKILSDKKYKNQLKEV